MSRSRGPSKKKEPEPLGKKNPEPEPLEEKKSEAGAAKKFTGSPALLFVYNCNIFPFFDPNGHV